jgi:hypothetical protein
MLRRSRFPVCVLAMVTLLSANPAASAGNFSSPAQQGIAEILGRLWQTIAALVAPPASTTASACSDSGSIMDPHGCPHG